MPRSNSIRPLFCLERKNHILFRVRQQFQLRIIFHKAILPVDRASELKSGIANGGVLVMFVHGVGGSLDVWQHQMSACQQRGYNVLAVDLLGHGGSQKPHDRRCYHFEHLTSDLMELFDAYKMATNVLVGHSYGASFCTFMAVERATDVSGIVLIAGGSPTPLQPQPCSIFSCPLPVLTWMHSPLVTRYSRLAFYIKPGANAAVEEACIHVSPFVLNAVMRGQLWPDSTIDYHSRLSLPVLLLAGRQDKLVSVAEEEWMHEIVVGSQLKVIEDAGHMLIVEKPDVVNGHMLTFISQVLMAQKDSGDGAVQPDNSQCRHDLSQSVQSIKSHQWLSPSQSSSTCSRSFRRVKTIL